MIAYPQNELFNGDVNAQAHAAFDTSEISKQSLDKIEMAYPCKLYTPHFFIAVALGLLTIIAVIFSGFLAWLLTSADSSAGIAALCFFMAALCYFLLERMVKSKWYYNSGVDNALMLFVVGFAAGIFMSNFDHISWIVCNGVLVLIAAWLSYRFNDALMAVISVAFILIVVFLLILKLGDTGLYLAPFIMMFVIGAIYYLVNKLKKRANFIYEKTLVAFTIFLLVAFYAAGNYWVINTLQSAVNNAEGPLAFGWLFWIFTILIPIVYILYGIVKKDLLHIRTGLLLIALTILTYKYYFTLLPVEFEMLVAGLLLVGLSYFLIKWLAPARHGYTSEGTGPRPDWKNIEGLVIAETMSGEQTTTTSDSLMAGGSGGGAGASGEF